jgi:DNA-binding transcriptional regulator YdaS (Cro superfamily)
MFDPAYDDPSFDPAADPVMVAICAAVIDAAGGPLALADKLGIRPQAITQWVIVPPERALKLEMLTGISVHKMRPDIFGRDPSPAKQRRRRQLVKQHREQAAEAA